MKKGFTLIELLVVIAIIGLLASVVLASLNSARVKAANASVKSNLATVRSQAALYFDTNGNSYDGLFDSGSVARAAFDAAVLASGEVDTFLGTGEVGYFVASDGEWTALVNLRVEQAYWCVDNYGFSNLVHYSDPNDPGAFGNAIQEFASNAVTTCVEFSEMGGQ